jgi:hypothetical protein
MQASESGLLGNERATLAAAAESPVQSLRERDFQGLLGDRSRVLENISRL